MLSVEDGDGNSCPPRPAVAVRVDEMSLPDVGKESAKLVRVGHGLVCEPLEGPGQHFVLALLRTLGESAQTCSVKVPTCER